MKQRPTSPKAGADPLFSTLFFLGVFVLLWPTVLIGLLLWRIIHGRASWLWFLILVIGGTAAFFLWKLDDPIHQLQVIVNVVDFSHPLPLLQHRVLPFWESTTALAPLIAGAIEFFRPRSAQERLLAEHARTQQRRRQHAQQA